MPIIYPDLQLDYKVATHPIFGVVLCRKPTMMVRHIRLDRRQFYLFEGVGINSQLRFVRNGFGAHAFFLPK
jgi:hypothetical protein